jgi:hypothetical protein
VNWRIWRFWTDLNRCEPSLGASNRSFVQGITTLGDTWYHMMPIQQGATE